MSAVTRGGARRCALPGCGRRLTPAQVKRGGLFCGRPCRDTARLKAPRSTRTRCRACGGPLSKRQVSLRFDHCSIRCAMVTRLGRPAPTLRTTCRECDNPLTKRQQWRRRDFCSKACAKADEWRRRPELKARAKARSAATHRRQFVARLRAFLQTATPEAAGRRGWRNGKSVAERRARHRGWVQLGPIYGVHSARRRAIVAAAPTVAEAYRRCYAEAYAVTWANHARPTVAA